MCELRGQLRGIPVIELRLPALVTKATICPALKLYSYYDPVFLLNDFPKRLNFEGKKCTFLLGMRLTMHERWVRIEENTRTLMSL